MLERQSLPPLLAALAAASVAVYLSVRFKGVPQSGRPWWVTPAAAASSSACSQCLVGLIRQRLASR